ncbi:hypothetical protein GCM10010201_30950 [Pilimelia columellifera subsp. columellifera]|uniref:ARB-07466-like C-terminal domain-containing protein n=1 Tax=Pilimelia columellifera subsp. columellifera TaxID=706583 RepID=A0ABN3NQX2_9ACTN
MLTVLVRRLMATVVSMTVVLAAASPAPAQADPDDTGGEGETPLVRDVLEDASRGYLEAKVKLTASQKRQEKLTGELGGLERRRDIINAEVSRIAAAGYRAGRLNAASALLRSAGPDAFLDRAAALERMTSREDQRLRELNQAQEDVARAKAAIDSEVAQQRHQFAVMTKKKDAAVRLLSITGGKATGGLVSANLPTARQAPRGRDGSWPGQSCTADDPTTSGCITPRTLHAVRESKRLGYTRFVSCFRTGGPFEHPKGRACDYSVQKGKGFGGHATGADRRYGNDLAAFLVKNADRLGVMYVIWYRQVWLPSVGWTNYTRAFGDPSSDHTNHVHLSML